MDGLDPYIANRVNTVVDIISVSINVLTAIIAVFFILKANPSPLFKIVLAIGVLAGAGDLISLLFVFIFRNNLYFKIFYTLVEGICWLLFYRNFFSRFTFFLNNKRLFNTFIVTFCVIYLMDLLIIFSSYRSEFNLFNLISIVSYCSLSFCAFCALYLLLKNESQIKIKDQPFLFINAAVLIYYFCGIIVLIARSSITPIDTTYKFYTFELITIFFYFLINVSYCMFIILAYFKFRKSEAEYKESLP